MPPCCAVTYTLINVCADAVKTPVCHSLTHFSAAGYSDERHVLLLTARVAAPSLMRGVSIATRLTPGPISKPLCMQCRSPGSSRRCHFTVLLIQLSIYYLPARRSRRRPPRNGSCNSRGAWGEGCAPFSRLSKRPHRSQTARKRSAYRPVID